MFEDVFKAGGMEALKQGLEATWRTHREVTQNLANVDTPGYVARRTDFRSLLVGGPGELAGAERSEGLELFVQDQAQGARGVNVEEEMARLSQSTLEQAALVRLLSSRYQGLMTAIREGR